MMKTKIKLGTRGSKLAVIQSKEAVGIISATFPEIDVETVIIKTEGDRDGLTPLSGFGGRGAFVKAIENEIIAGNIDIAVHSLKDLPSKLPDGLVLGAVPVREDPRDVIISLKYPDIGQFPSGAVIGTGSARRRIQIAGIRGDFIFKDIRGNVDTRIKKLRNGDYDGIILAAAGLNRLSLSDFISGYIDTGVSIPAPGQGAVGIECRENDSRILEIMSAIDDERLHFCADVERKFISDIGLGCHSPVGAYARFEGDKLFFTGFAADMDTGRISRKDFYSGKDTSLKNAMNVAAEIKSELNLN